VILSLGLSLLLLDGRWNRQFISPGKLSPAHAALTESTHSTCVVCHVAASAKPHRWLNSVWTGNAAVAGSRSCLACHFTAMDGRQAMQAHGVAEGLERTAAGDSARPGLALSLAALVGSPAGDGKMACTSCHHQHRGMGDPTAALNDIQCQACHQSRFDHFGASHPEFATTTTTDTSLGFNHKKHRSFFQNDQLPCRQCHLREEGFLATQTSGYRENCAGCHQQGKEDWHGSEIGKQVVTLVQPPEMEFDDPLYWPVNTGSVIPALMWTLLLGDDAALMALQDLFESEDMELDAEPFEWYPEDGQRKLALARAVQRLIRDLVKGDDQALRERLARAFDLAPGSPWVTGFVEQLRGSGFTMRAYQLRWLPELFAPTENAIEKLPAANHGRVQQTAAPGWFIDHEDVSVRYRPSGHGDGFLRAWIELLSSSRGQARGDFRYSVRDAIDQQLTGPGGLLRKACLNCHVALRKGSVPGARWRTVVKPQRASGFAKFRHDVHVAIVEPAAQCNGCHELAASGQSGDFMPYTVAQCSGCHTSGKAGTSCLHCHNYHFVQP